MSSSNSPARCSGSNSDSDVALSPSPDPGSVRARETGRIRPSRPSSPRQARGGSRLRSRRPRGSPTRTAGAPRPWPPPAAAGCGGSTPRRRGRARGDRRGSSEDARRDRPDGGPPPRGSRRGTTRPRGGRKLPPRGGGRTGSSGGRQHPPVPIGPLQKEGVGLPEVRREGEHADALGEAGEEGLLREPSLRNLAQLGGGERRGEGVAPELSTGRNGIR